MNLLSPDRVRQLLHTPGPSKAKVMPPPAKTSGGIPRAALVIMEGYLLRGYSEKRSAELAGIPVGSASYAGKLVRGLR